MKLPPSMRYTLAISNQLSQSLKLLTITHLHKKQTKNQSDLALRRPGEEHLWQKASNVCSVFQGLHFTPSASAPCTHSTSQVMSTHLIR